MKLDARDTLNHPKELVWATYRDELPNLVGYLPNIDKIECISREEPELGVIELVNEWHARGEIPAVARRFIKPEMLRWRDEARWEESRWICSWETKVAFFTENVKVKGETIYTDLGGDRTELHIAGLLNVDVRGIRGVPRLLAGPVNAAVEKLVSSLILPNMRRLNVSVGKYLDERAGA